MCLVAKRMRFLVSYSKDLFFLMCFGKRQALTVSRGKFCPIISKILPNPVIPASYASKFGID